MENLLFDEKKEVPFFNGSDPLVWRETHRIMELLRFTPDSEGILTARCAPDNYVLPALGAYFLARFIELPWAIIDEKRGLCLLRKQGEKPQIIEWNETEENAKQEAETDEWEELWKHYHKTINNEDRYNPKLQKQLMPQRYWKYLPEKN